MTTEINEKMLQEVYAIHHNGNAEMYVYESDDKEDAQAQVDFLNECGDNYTMERAFYLSGDFGGVFYRASQYDASQHDESACVVNYKGGDLVLDQVEFNSDN